MTDEERFVECEKHGKQQETFVCQHIIQTLQDNKPRGFCWADDPEKPRPDAWCSECESRVQATDGEWTDDSEAFAGVKLLCSECYNKAKEINMELKNNSSRFGNDVL